MIPLGLIFVLGAIIGLSQGNFKIAGAFLAAGIVLLGLRFIMRSNRRDRTMQARRSRR